MGPLRSAGLPLSSASAAGSGQGGRGQLAVDLAVILGELAEMPEPVRQGGGLDRVPGAAGAEQCYTDKAHPAQLEIAVRAHLEHVLERLVQRGRGNAQGLA